METQIRHSNMDAYICFDPTYKGWKPSGINTSSSKARCFDPTYKGWKPGEEFDEEDDLKSFDPTYKGWKQNRINRIFF